MSLPGGFLHRVAARLFTPTTISRVVEPVIADWQAEYASAVKQGRVWASRWIRWSGYVVCARALAVYGASRMAGFARGWSADERRALSRIVRIGGLVAVGVMVLFTGSFLLSQTGFPYYLLLPQAVPIATPIGMLFGVLYGWRDRAFSRRLGIVVGLLAVAMCVQSLVVLDRLMPAANQSFRVAVYQSLSARFPTDPARSVEPERGMSERSLSGLRAAMNVARNQGLNTRARGLAFAFYERLALGFAPLPLMSFALAVVWRRRQFGHFTLAMIGWGSLTLYFTLIVLGSGLARSGLPPLFVWLPHVGLLALALAIRTRSRAASTLPA